MISIKPTLTPILILLSLMLSTLALARDVALEQASVTAARQDYDQAKTAYDDVTYAVNLLEKKQKMLDSAWSSKK
jgi:hypothetical protein